VCAAVQMNKRTAASAPARVRRLVARLESWQDMGNLPIECR
jgi:hypothetical protein